MEKKAGKGISKVKILVIAVAVFVAIRVIAAFPVVTHGETKMLLFSAERLVSIDPLSELMGSVDGFDGRVLGNYVLETEYGKITLDKFILIGCNANRAFMMPDASTVGRIGVKNFREGKASHSLVVEGIEIPPNINVGFNRDQTLSTIVVFSPNETTISGVPFWIGDIYINDPDVADIVIGGNARPPHIALADTTEIDTTQFSGELNIYKDKEQWVLASARDDVFLIVKLPGETEFTRYKSLTFGKEWGAFIEGELWEE
jgi:hypothetical protein